MRAKRILYISGSIDGLPLAERALPVGVGLVRLLDGGLHLLRVALALRSDGLAKVCASVLTSPSTGETIRSYAHERRVGLIALASHGRGGLSRAVWGSVTIETVSNAAIPTVPSGTLMAVDAKAPTHRGDQPERSTLAHSLTVNSVADDLALQPSEGLPTAEPAERLSRFEKFVRRHTRSA